MSGKFSSLRQSGTHLWQGILRLTAGGRWTDRLPAPARFNLRCFWFDGMLADSSEAILLAYLSLFVLALGASRAQIGLMSALSNLSGALLLLPGAALVERIGRRKRLVVFTGGGVSRLVLLLLALLPLAFVGPAAVWIAIGLVIVRSASSNLGVPAWTSLTADIVPLTWRGRYFASRNIAMALGGLVCTGLAGLLITRIGGFAGYQWALGLAFVVGLGSTMSYASMREPPMTVAARKAGPASSASFWQHLRAQPEFLTFCATAALWNLSLNIAGPFFKVYLAEGLMATPAIVGLISVLGSLAALPGHRLFGLLADRWGPRRVQLITGLLIPGLPLGWALANSPWQLMPVEIASGFLWAGYGLSSFNFLLTLMPEDDRPQYSALYQVVVMGSLSAGAAFGGLIAGQWGYQAVFVLSCLGRLTAALLFARFVRSSPSVSSLSASHQPAGQ